MGVLRRFDVSLVTPTRLLDDLAEDLAGTIVAPVGAEIEVHIGLQRPDDLARLASHQRPPLVIGIQTEQIIDADGRPLWQNHLVRRILANLATYDLVLDLSEANRPIYADLPDNLRSRLRFGPHIFPTVPPALRPAPDGPIVFVGGMNERRRALIGQLVQRGIPIDIVRRGTFKADLKPKVDAASAMLNLHFHDGRYTEVPRVLKAVLAGKPLVSERLAPPFIAGEHFLLLDDANLGRAPMAAAAERLAALLCANYSFQGFLHLSAKERGLVT